MEEKVFLGLQWGTFSAQDGRQVPYCSLFVMEPFTAMNSDNYHTFGHKAAKYKMVDPDIAKGLEPFDLVECYFSSKGAVTKMVQIGKLGPDGEFSDNTSHVGN